MAGIKIERELRENRDDSARQARHKLRVCCLLVLNVVRIQRQAKGSAFTRLNDSTFDFSVVAEDVQRRLHDLVTIARPTLQSRRTAHDLLLRGLFSIRSSAILPRLCAEDFRATAQSLLNDYTELRETVFEGNAFQEWQKGDSWYLHFYGHPRCGKSAFAAATSERLEEQYSGDVKVVVISLFLGHSSIKNRLASAQGVLGAILKQLIERKSKHSGGWSILHDLDLEEMRALPDSSDLLRKCIIREMAQLEQVFLVVDGSTAHSTGNENFSLEEELVGLQELCRASPCTLRVLLIQDWTETFGPEMLHGAICDALGPQGNACGATCEDHYWTCERCAENFYICQTCYSQGRRCNDSSHILQVKLGMQSELSRYIRTKLDAIGAKMNVGRRMSGALGIAQHIQSDIDIKSRGALVIAKLYIDSLLEQQSIEEVLDKKDRLSLYQRLFYDSLMFEILSQETEDKTLALSCLALVAKYCDGDGVAMVFEELRDAICRITGRDNRSLTRSHLLECTKGLLAIPNTVMPFHESAGTYLAQECEDFLGYHNLDLGVMCVEAIQEYLAEWPPCRVSSLEELTHELNNNPFVAYSLRNWGTNLRMASIDQAKRICLEFCDGSLERNSRFWQMTFLAMNSMEGSETWSGGNMLHLFVWFGLWDMLMLVLGEHGTHCDPNAQDMRKRTLLHIACTRGDQRIVSTLLSLGADPSIRDSEGRTVLWEAVEHDEPDIVRIILKHISSQVGPDAMINAGDPRFGNQTVLMLAIKEHRANRDRIVEMLLQQDELDLDVKDSAGRTALHIAATTGYWKLFELLTDDRNFTCAASVDLNAQDLAGRTVFINALTSGELSSDELIGLLDVMRELENRIDLDLSDVNGRSLLHCAVSDQKYRPFVEYLRQAKTSLNRPDAHGRTPLHIAVANEAPPAEGSAEETTDGEDSEAEEWTGSVPSEEQTFEEQLERSEMIDQEYLEAEPADDTSAEEMSEEDHPMVRLLLDMQADLRARDEQSMTAYDLAVQMKAPWAQELLFDGHVQPEKEQLILWSDAVTDPDEFFQDVSGFPDSAMCQADELCFSLLHCAVDAGQVEAVRHLLQNQHVKVNSQNQIYNTPLHMALGNVEVLELLLAHDSIDVNIVDHEGRAALERAFDNKNEDHKFRVAIALIRRGADLILPLQARQDILNYVLGHEEILNGDLEVVKLLLDGGTSVFKHRRSGLLPSQAAQQDGASKALVELLQDHERNVIGGVTSL